MPFMGEHDWSTEWSSDLNLAYSTKTREARGTMSAKDARPGYLKRKNHASMPQLGQVLKHVPRPATYADEVNNLRHPPRSLPKRSQSLDYPTMAEQNEAKAGPKHVHFVDEGYGSSATSPAASPKQEPKSDEDDSRSSTSDSDFEQLASQQQQMTLNDDAPRAVSKAEAQSQPSKPQRVITLEISSCPAHSAKSSVQAQTPLQRASRPTASRKPTSKRSTTQGQKTRTGGSYRNNNGNICFEEFNYFGGF